jgi:thiol-disulfide isomerase/thioredoxin
MTDYDAKYLKYKTKYLNLKKLADMKMQKGGQNPEHTISLYKAQWCGFCTQFEPVWNKLQQNNTNKKVKFETYEYTNDNHKSAFEQKQIQGFPTLLVNNKAYQGERTYEELQNYINNL